MIFSALLSLLCLGVAQAQDVRTYIPSRAQQYLPVVKQQAKEVLPQAPVAYFPALIEHESCISLVHAKCWSPTAQLKTSREEGAGLGQLTRAFNPDGSIRFDSLSAVRGMDPRGLNALRWDTVYSRPDLQIRAVVVMVRELWDTLSMLVPHGDGLLAMVDAGYNGGLGGVMDERRACMFHTGCDPNKWFGHVENVCLKSRKPLYGGRSACDINRNHVKDVLTVRMPKYVGVI